MADPVSAEYPAIGSTFTSPSPDRTGGVGVCADVHRGADSADGGGSATAFVGVR